MSIGGTLNSNQGFNQTKGNTKSQLNLFNKLQLLAAELFHVDQNLVLLVEECASIREQKQNVNDYLERKSEQNRLRLMGELQMFQNEIKHKIQTARKETQKIDEHIASIKEAQLMTLQMILQVQRRVQELEVQLGTAPTE